MDRLKILAAVFLLGLGPATRAAPPASATSPGSVQRLPAYRIFAEPRDQGEASTYPWPDTLQIQRWRAKRFEWEIRFLKNSASYAQILFRHPIDLRPYIARSFLRFRVRPDLMAPHLAVGLLDCPEEGATPILVNVPLAPCRVWQRNAEGYYAIPLKAFGTRGRGLSSDEKELPTTEEGALNWSRIGGIRVAVAGESPPHGTFVITHLQIGGAVNIAEQEE